jgi:hypothetical protein
MTHRPWPVPDRPWTMRMRWCDLLFTHWAVDAAILRRLIPEGLELDLFDGQGYVGAVPFRMEGVTPRLVPAVPGWHAFPELNLRTYVKAVERRACGFSVWMPGRGWRLERPGDFFTCLILTRSLRLEMWAGVWSTRLCALIAGTGCRVCCELLAGGGRCTGPLRAVWMRG